MCIYLHHYLKTRRIIMKRFIPVFILCVIGVCLTACGESNTGTKASGSTASTPRAAAPAQHFKVSDTVKVGDTWQVVVNSVKTDPGEQIDISQTRRCLFARRCDDYQ